MSDGRGVRRLGSVRGFSRWITGLALFAATAAGPAPAAEPVRVASLLPFVSEAVGLVPGRAVVVASARTDLHTPPPAGIVDLGNPHAPDLEGLAAAKPGIVV